MDGVRRRPPPMTHLFFVRAPRLLGRLRHLGRDGHVRDRGVASEVDGHGVRHGTDLGLLRELHLVRGASGCGAEAAAATARSYG